MDEITAARRAAQALWADWHVELPALANPLIAMPVEALAEQQGVTIDYFAATEEPGTLGYLDPIDPLIWLSDALAPTVERFTLAHELGHWCLHRDHRERSNCAAVDIPQHLDEQDQATLALPAEAYSPRSRRERQANAFAAELLAPLALVRRAYLGLVGIAPQTIDQIATAFGVSKAVIIAQLTQLLTMAPPQPLPSEAGEGLAGTFGVSDGEPEERIDPARFLAFAPTGSDAHGRDQSYGSDGRDQSRPYATPSPNDHPLSISDGEGAGERGRPDPAQQVAVIAPTPTLVVAGPGTGKTSTLVARVRWLIARGAAPDAILALTFSRKAAQELRDRIGTALGDGMAGTLPTVTTFHQFCGDLLRSYGYLVGLRPDFRLVDQIAAFFVLRDLAGELPLSHYASLAAPTQYFGDLLGAISQAKDELVDPPRYRELALAMEEAEAREKALEVATVYAIYQTELARRKDADYGDLIQLAVRLFSEQPQVLATVRQQYGHLLVDEFQDINRANGILLRQLAGAEGNIWAVGDANQAIYRFRGASPANIANFRDDYPRATVTPLDRNYRSRPAIVAAANRFAATVLNNARNPSLVALAATRPDEGQQVILRIASDAPSEIAAIVADLARRHANGAPWGDHAVLCRTRALVRQITSALQAASIPAESQADLFSNEAIKDALGIAHLLAGETGGLLRAARVPDHALARATVQALLDRMRADQSSLPTAIAAELAAVADVPQAGEPDGLRQLQAVLARLGRYASIGQALSAYLIEITTLARAHLVAGDVTSRHLAELLALAARFDAERATPDAGDPEQTTTRRWQAFIAFVRAVRTLPREALAAIEEDAPRDQVRVLTVHGAKGLEWPVVYLPKLARRYFPASNQHDFAPPPPGLVAHAQDDPKADHLLEEACLFYVAITRARDTLVLSRAERYTVSSRANPSPFLAPVLHGDEVITEMLPAMRSATDLADEDDEAALLPLPTTAAPAFAPPAALTASALSTYDRCPRQYAYRYGYRFAGGRNAYWRLRRAVADALRSAQQPNSDTTQALGIFDAAWQADATYHPDIAAPDPFDALYLRHGRHAVATAFQQVRAPQSAAPADFIQAVEVAVAETIIRVELDRTEAQADAADAPRRVVRHQMGRRPTTPPDPSLGVYLQVLAQRALNHDEQADTIAEHHLNAGEMVAVTLSPKQEAKLRTQVHAAIAGIHAASFPALPEDRKCAGCEFALICPA